MLTNHPSTTDRSEPSAEPDSRADRTGSSDDRWWSRKPAEQRRPLWSSRLLWNTFEFRHPWKVYLATLLGLVAIVMVFVALTVGGGDDGGTRIIEIDDNGETVVTDGTETGFVELDGAVLPLFTFGADDIDAALGSTAPDVRVTTITGDDLTIDSSDGTARIFGFFAHWSPNDQAQLPVLVDWLATDPLPDGTEFVAVSTSVASDQANYPPSEWFEREGLAGTVLRDDESETLADGFGVMAFPFWVVVDDDGVVVDRVAGELTVGQLQALASPVD